MLFKKSLRKQLFVDPKVQGALVYRVILYWMACLAAIVLMLLCGRILTGPARLFYTHFNEMWFFYGPVLLASLLLLPLVVIDIIRLSNRFTGPLLRLRRSMRALARGEHVQPLDFREGDFWKDFADQFNQLAARVEDETSSTETGGELDPTPDEAEQPVAVGAD